VVLVHGNPSWGFVYRNFVGPLAAVGYRVIVPDHLGFGRSDKPHDASLCTVSRHVERPGRGRWRTYADDPDIGGSPARPAVWCRQGILAV
jgi:pimeloyl-ACP methyl ester carboxylesterase